MSTGSQSENSEFVSIETGLCLPAGAEEDLLEAWWVAGESVPARSEVWSVAGFSLIDLLVDWILETVWELPRKSVGDCLLDSDESDLSVACLCGEWSVPAKSVTQGLSVGLMNGSEDLVIPTGGEVVGVTLTVAKVGSGLSKVFASKRASNLLNLSYHFWSYSSILASAGGFGCRRFDRFLWTGFGVLWRMAFRFICRVRLLCLSAWSRTRGLYHLLAIHSSHYRHWGRIKRGTVGVLSGSVNRFLKYPFLFFKPITRCG